MKRAAKLTPLRLSLDPATSSTLWRRLSVSLRVAIASGRLGPGARLPSSRELARQLDVSRNTVMAAYEDLADRGLLLGRTGAGSFVANTTRAVPHAQVRFQDDSGNLLALAPLS